MSSTIVAPQKPTIISTLSVIVTSWFLCHMDTLLLLEDMDMIIVSLLSSNTRENKLSLTGVYVALFAEIRACSILATSQQSLRSHYYSL